MVSQNVLCSCEGKWAFFKNNFKSASEIYIYINRYFILLLSAANGYHFIVVTLEAWFKWYLRMCCARVSENGPFLKAISNLQVKSIYTNRYFILLLSAVNGYHFIVVTLDAWFKWYLKICLLDFFLSGSFEDIGMFRYVNI